MLGIASREVRLHWRQAGGRRVVFSEDALRNVAAAFERNGAELGKWGEALDECVGGLPARTRALLEMRYEKGLKPREIAGRLGGQANAVAAALYRARAALQECMERRVAAYGGRAS